MKRKSWLLVCALLLVGCASSYKLSDDGLKFRNSLTDARALSEVQKYASKSAAQAGVCAAHTNDQFMQANPVAVKEGFLVFNSFIKVMTGVSTSSVGVGMATTISSDHRPAVFRMDLKKLDKIRVFGETKGLCVPAAASGYVVMIDTKGVADSAKAEANAVMINVSKGNVDNLVAALSFLSPNARLIEGAGL